MLPQRPNTWSRDRFERVADCFAKSAIGATIGLLVVTATTVRGQPSIGIGQDDRGARLLAFQFGPGNSASRPGFTKVTAKDQYTTEKGYGFESTQELLEFDRGGSAIVRPTDEYTARTYGAYRTTSDLTCSLIEGTTNNAFQIAAPDGDYTVWLIASDAEWDPPLFEVLANDQKKLDVRVPRARFVFMEPLQARAVDGRLRLEFKGPHGWILSGLLIGRDGPELTEAVREIERDIFFLTEPELPNWTEAKTESRNPPLEWTAAEREKGYVVFPVDYTEQITPAFQPQRADLEGPLTAFATPGELEPTSFCVSAQRDLGKVTLELNRFVAENTNTSIAAENVQVGIVRCWPQRESGWGPKGQYRVVPEMIEAPVGRACQVGNGQLKQWWLTVRVPSDAAPGRYRMSLTVRPEKAEPTVLDWRLLVLPFQLSRPAERHWGTWLESFPPVGGLSGPDRRGRNTLAEQQRLVRADLTDYRDHGFDLAIFNYYFGVKENADGTFTYDISAMARDLDYWKTLGSSTPVAIGCEYTFRNLEYGFAEPGQEHVPGTFSPKARRAIVGLVHHIHDEALRRGWPKLYFYPIDEPGNSKTENRLRFAENVLDMVHEVPGCQTVTTVGASDVQRLGNRVDVRIYAYGNYNRNKVLQDSRQGHPFWFYENGMFYAHNTVASRSMTGFEFLRSGAEVATAWGFDAIKDNPFNDFDGGHKDWNVVFHGVDKLTPTIYWELCREGVDDCRYLATLQERIKEARKSGKTEEAQRAEAVLQPLLDPDGPPLENPLAFTRYRWRIAREILFLLGEQEFVLPFPAVAKNIPAPAKVGPNQIVDPSFEAGPQADGFPVLTYDIGDRYSKPDQKPVGALKVEEGVAHSGRYSLKWDFSQAPGKGSIYEGRRYLITNVQISEDVAKQLRGKRVQVGYWIRLEGGGALPGLVLRQFGKNEFLDGLSYSGGVDDPSVWNHFQAEGRLRNDFEGLDIHISCPVPDDPQIARKSVFYIDDVSLCEIEEPPLTISTSFDEYYAGENLAWTLSANSIRGQAKVQLLLTERVEAEQTWPLENSELHGAFETAKLRPGIYTINASVRSSQGTEQNARCEVILAPAIFNSWIK